MVNVKKRRSSKNITVMSVVLSTICLVLSVVDVYGCVKNNLVSYSNTMESYLKMLITNGSYKANEVEGSIVDGIVVAIENEFPTSASFYCIVAVDDEIVFLRDKSVTSNTHDVMFSEYLNLETDNSILVTDYGRSLISELDNGNKYLISKENIDTGNEVITIAICTDAEYMMKNGNFDILLQHLVLYLVLLSIAFITSVIYLNFRDKENIRIEAELNNKLIENRILIERLGDKIDNQNNSDITDRSGGFYTEEVIEQVISSLTEEQKEKSRKVTIKFSNNDLQLAVRYSVLLERMRVTKSIFCLREEDEILVVMLNTEEDGVNNFAKQFIMQYQNMFQSDVKDTKIIIDKL